MSCKVNRAQPQVDMLQIVYRLLHRLDATSTGTSTCQGEAGEGQAVADHKGGPPPDDDRRDLPHLEQGVSLGFSRALPDC